MTVLPQDLEEALGHLAGLPVVLVATDFDGTLAPLQEDPSSSRSLPGGVEALLGLDRLTGVTGAVVSGRDLATLRRLTGQSAAGLDVERLVYVGSHGAETSLPDGASRLTPEQTGLLDALTDELRAVARAHGARLETKPTSSVLHTRGLEGASADAARAAADEVADHHPGVTATAGKDVLELAVTETSKGVALSALAERLAADGTLYLGDDVTDETAFEALTGARDVTVKVGDGPSSARFRVADEAAAVAVLTRLAELRATG